MEYHIINRVQLFNGSLIKTTIGYTLSHEDAIALEGWCEWDEWANANSEGLTDGSILLSEYFDIHPICYEAGWVTNNIDGLGINLINSL
jgi:hypothetical protein